jgi:plastocyanin
MKLTKFFAFALAALAFVGCGGDEQEPGKPAPKPSGNITLKASETAITIGETITFTVTDTEGQDVTAVAQIYDPDFSELTNKKYTATETGTFEFFATCEGEYSNTVVVKVMAEMPEVPEDMEPEHFKFNHRAVMVDHTAVNCGYCPWMTDYLIQYALTPNHKHYNEVTCHAGTLASGDPAASTAATTLMNYHSLYFDFGNPTLIFNFKSGEVGNSSSYGTVKSNIDKLLTDYIKADGADVGISMTVEGDEDNILCAAQIKVAVDGDYCVNAWLLESDIYSPNQNGATKEEHKWYNFALRNFSESVSKTDIKGLEIGQLKAGDKYNYACELAITSTKWNWENMGVLVVVSAKDDKGRVEVVNSAYCPVGEELPFEYL